MHPGLDLKTGTLTTVRLTNCALASFLTQFKTDLSGVAPADAPRA